MDNNTGFKKVSGGYEKRTSETTKIFIQDAFVESFDEATGTVEMYKPKYEPLAPAKEAKPGINSYYYENEEAPTGGDFEMTIGHYGGYYLKPLRDGLTLKGRGIRYDGNWYKVTDLALEKIKNQYRIIYEMCFD